MNINYFGEIDINLNNVTFNAIKFDDVLQSANSDIIFLFPLTLTIRRCLETLEVGIVE
jgi:NADH:ubiquinone oxidoreductase subunit K